MTAALLRICAGLLLSVVCASCSTPDVEVVFYVYDGYTFSPAEQRTIETIAAAAVRDARRLLPGLPDHLIIRVNPGSAFHSHVVMPRASCSDAEAPSRRGMHGPDIVFSAGASEGLARGTTQPTTRATRDQLLIVGCGVLAARRGATSMGARRLCVKGE